MAKDLVNQIERQIVHTESLFAVDNDFSDERFMKVRIAVLHSGINRNQSRFSKETIENAKTTFANIPILAEVKKFVDEEGNERLDYTTHAMHLEDDAFNSDEQRMIYDEQVVGIVPETNDFEMVFDEETGNYYAWVSALLYREYGNYVCDILESKGGITDISAEILCDKCSYSAQDKCLDVGEMTMSGITLLGDDVTPGMAKAHATVFSANETRQDQLIKIMQELKESLDNYRAVFTATKDTMKGGQNQVNKFEMLLEQYGKTVEDITFEYEGLSDEELETAFANAFEEQKKKIEDDDASVVETEETPEVEENVENKPATASEEPVEELTEEPAEETGDVEVDLNALNYSVSIGDIKKEFAVSLAEKQYAVYNLVNETYAEIDNDFYDVDVYEESKEIVMHGWYSGRHYRQSYKVKKDSYSLIGDRIEVYAQYLTNDEISQLDSMKGKFAEVSEKLAKYEAEPEKLELLESNEYSSIADKEEFIELKKQENHFNLSIDELRNEADKIILNYAKKGSLTFAANETEHHSVGMKLFATTKKSTKRSRYGGLGKKED